MNYMTSINYTHSWYTQINFYLINFIFLFQQLLRSHNPALSNTPNGQHIPPSMPPAMAAQQQFLAQQNAAYAQQTSYMMPGQDGNPFMATMLAPQAYYGMPPWVYPAGLIPQQGTQPRRPLTPSQGAENQSFVSFWIFYARCKCVNSKSIRHINLNILYLKLLVAVNETTNRLTFDYQFTIYIY